MMHGEATFYANLLSDPEVRSRLDTEAKCNELIDSMEEYVPHDRLPKHYDWLIGQRNRLMENRKQESK